MSRVYCAARKGDDTINEKIEGGCRAGACARSCLHCRAALRARRHRPVLGADLSHTAGAIDRGFGAGGPTDVIARIIAQKLSEAWGQQVYTENLPGAGGNTGVATVARAPADGYTILVVSTGFMVNPSMYAKIPYDPIKDFAPITLVAASPNVVSVHPSFPAKTLKELVELVKAHPGKYSFAQPSTGSTPHLAGELFKQQYRLDLVTVPFNSAALAINSTIGGHTPIAFTALPPAMANIKDGKLRGLAVLSVRRAPALPDVPTNAEAGIPDLESDTLTGIVAPAGTPKDV